MDNFIRFSDKTYHKIGIVQENNFTEFYLMEAALKNTICKNIRNLRKKYNYSQEDMAVRLNIEQNSYSRMERGETKLDIERLHQIAGIFNISFFQLLEVSPPRNKIIEELSQ